MRVRWWSSTASVVLGVFVVLGVWLLAVGRDPGGVVCLVLAAVYVPSRLVRGYLGVSGRGRRAGMR